MALCSRTLVIKIAFLAGALLVLLNIISSHSYFRPPSNNIVPASNLQWPKRTRPGPNSGVAHSETTSEEPPDKKSDETIKQFAEEKDVVTTILLPTIEDTNVTSSTSSNVIVDYESKAINEGKPLRIIVESQTNSIPSHTTEYHIFQSLLTSLGLLTPCPATPPNLQGPIKPDITEEAPETVINRFKSKLQPGGWYKPSECTARDRVAIIIPYRNRPKHVWIFLKNMHPFLMKQQLEYRIFIVEQTPGSLFNRAALMNIGVLEAKKAGTFDCFVFHDIDLLPLDDRNLYTCPDQPRHMSVAVDKLDFRLPYNSLFGGVSSMRPEHFEKLNGFSNAYWGWGGEDDDMSNRLTHAGFHIARYPVNIARYIMLDHVKEKPNPKRYENLASGAKRFKTDGLNSVRYTLKKIENLPLFTHVYVDLTPLSPPTE